MIVDPTVLSVFCVSAFLIMIMPGADMILIVTNSISGGKRSGAISALGISSGAILHFIAAALGISAIILTSEIAYDVVRMMGSGYLIWLGFQYLTRKSTIASVQMVRCRPALQIYRQGVMTNLLNPKAILFNLSFVPQFVSVGYGAVWVQILVLGAILIIMGIMVNLSIVVLASQLSSFMSGKSSSFAFCIERAAGIVLIALAIYVALARRPVQ